MDNAPPIEYVAYSGLGRRPTIWGVPYMAGLAIMSVSLLGATALGVQLGPTGWLFALLGAPVAWFVRVLCATDDRAIEVLLLEARWALIGLARGNARFHGGTLTLSAIAYGRRVTDAQHYFAKAARG